MTSSNVLSYPAATTREEVQATGSIFLLPPSSIGTIHTSDITLMCTQGYDQNDWSIEISNAQSIMLMPFIPVVGTYNFTVAINGQECTPSLTITIIPNQSSPLSSSPSFSYPLNGVYIVYWGEGLLGSRAGEESSIYARKQDKYGNIMYALNMKINNMNNNEIGPLEDHLSYSAVQTLVPLLSLRMPTPSSNTIPISLPISNVKPLQWLLSP